MKKVIVISLLLIFICSYNVVALSLDDFDKQLLLNVFKEIDSGEIEYMARLGLESEGIALVLYYYGNTGRELDKRELDKIIHNRESLSQFHLYFGLPPIMFEDDLVKFRRPQRNRHFPPLGKKKYNKKYSFKNGYEKIEVKGNKYEYQYQNKRLNIEEKIEIKQNKYNYYYRDNKMEEKMEIKYPNYKYNYYYKNFRTGRTIKKEGRGRPIDKDLFYEELKEESTKDSGFKIDVKINLNKLFD